MTKTDLPEEHILQDDDESLEQDEEETIEEDAEESEDFAKPLPFVTGMTLSVLPETSLENPYEIPIPAGAYPFLCPINSPLVGLAQDQDPITRPLRNALYIAKSWGYPVVLLTGNILHLDTTRAGKFQGFRAFGSDTQDSSSAFESIEDRLEMRLASLRKQVFNPDGMPIFPGPIYATFGRAEDEIINYWVSERVNIFVAEEKDRLSLEYNGLNAYLKELKKRRTSDERLLSSTDTLPLGEIEMIQNDLLFAKKEIARLEIDMRRIKQKRTLTNASTTSEGLKKEWFLHSQKRLIDLFQQSIHGLTIISTGNCIIKIKDKLVRIEQNPRQSIADTFSDQVQNDTRSHLKNGKSVPDLILIAGYSICGAYFRVNYPKSMDDPNEITSVHVVQLPMCVDASFLQRLADLSVRVGPFLTRLIISEYFTPGVVACGWISNFFVSHLWWNRDLVPKIPTHLHEQPSLAYTLFSKPELLDKMVKTQFMFYKESESDMQEGGKQQAYYDIPDAPFRLAPYEFHHDFFLRNNFPISHYLNGGDIVQGENHPFYHLEVPDKYLEPYRVKLYVHDLIYTAGTSTIEEKLQQMARFAVLNSWRIGIQRIDMQLEQYINQAYINGSDYFARVLRTCKRIGLTYIGKAAPVTIIGGNHFGNSPGVGKHFNESEICQRRLQTILHDRHNFSRDDAQKFVLAPLGSARNITRAVGAFGFDSVYPYCLSVKHKPGRGGARYQNPVKKMRAVRVRMGNTEPMYKDRFVIEEAGHIDRDAWCTIPHGFVSLIPGQEFQGPYAEEEDFALADMGTKVIGLPAPHKHFSSKEVFGPLIHISFAFEVFYQYIRTPWKVDVKALFPNAL